jgi:hypothetical protein
MKIIPKLSVLLRKHPKLLDVYVNAGTHVACRTIAPLNVLMKHLTNLLDAKSYYQQCVEALGGEYVRHSRTKSFAWPTSKYSQKVNRVPQNWGEAMSQYKSPLSVDKEPTPEVKPFSMQSLVQWDTTSPAASPMRGDGDYPCQVVAPSETVSVLVDVTDPNYQPTKVKLEDLYSSVGMQIQTMSCTSHNTDNPDVIVDDADGVDTTKIPDFSTPECRATWRANLAKDLAQADKDGNLQLKFYQDMVDTAYPDLDQEDSPTQPNVTGTIKANSLKEALKVLKDLAARLDPEEF